MAALLSPRLATAQSAGRADAFGEARAVIHALMADRHLTSVVVAAAKNGRIVWEQGFGWADAERRVRATPTVMYSLASISKPFTSTGLMLLARRGELDLDRPANDYLGTARLTADEGQASEATVRRIANHTSGLPLHYHFFYEDEGDRPSPFDTTIARYGILVSPPGTRAQYSNLGYGILGAIIARVSGTPYAEFMRREVFLPLGLTRTAVVTQPISGDTVAERYDSTGRPLPWFDFDHRGASAVYSSAHDLVRFGMFHLKDHTTGQRAILPDSILDAMHHPTSAEDEKIGYGMGWQTYNEDVGYPSIGHTGGMPGVSTRLKLFPASDIAIVVLINGYDSRAADRIVYTVAAALLPRYRQSLRVAHEDAGGESGAPVWSAPPGAVQGEWDGAVRTWQGVVPAHLSVSADSTVRVTVGTSSAQALTHLVWRDQVLSGECDGTIATPDAMSRPHHLLLNVRLHGDTLSGWIAAQASDPIRVNYALSSYVRMTREQP